MRLEIIFMNEFDPSIFDHYPVVIEGNTVTCSDKAWDVLRLADLIPVDKSIRFERGEKDGKESQSQDSS